MRSGRYLAVSRLSPCLAALAAMIASSALAAPTITNITPRSLAVGGTTTHIDFCFVRPGDDMAETIEQRTKRWQGNSYVDYAFHVTLAGALPLETLSDHLSDLACLILQQVLRLAWSHLRTRHRSDARFAVVWRETKAGWEMERVLSYAHRPVG